jgi:hypothetical protein
VARGWRGVAVVQHRSWIDARSWIAGGGFDWESQAPWIFVGRAYVSCSLYDTTPAPPLLRPGILKATRLLGGGHDVGAWFAVGSEGIPRFFPARTEIADSWPPWASQAGSWRAKASARV